MVPGVDCGRASSLYLSGDRPNLDRSEIPVIDALAASGSTTVPVAAARAVGATKRYGSGATAVTALDDVTVEFEAQQFTALMGPSGSG